MTSIDMISTTARGPGTDYDDDGYLYEDGEYSHNADAAESHSFHGEEVRSTTELGLSHDYEYEDEHTERGEFPTESTSKTYDKSSFRERDASRTTEVPGGDRHLLEEIERDTTASYASNEENNAGSLEYERSTRDMFKDGDMDHYENLEESGYGGSTEATVRYGSMPHSKGQNGVSEKPPHSSVGGSMNQSLPSGSGEISPHRHLNSREEEEEEYYPDELFSSNEHDQDYGRRRPRHQLHRRPYYYYPGYSEPRRPHHYGRDISEILRLVKKLLDRQNGRAETGRAHNRGENYRSIDGSSSFPSHYE